MAIASNDFREVQNQASISMKEVFNKLSWSSVIGGFFVAILTYWFLISIGIGAGAFGLKSDVVDATTFKALSAFGIVWMVVSNCLALLFGGYSFMKLSRRLNQNQSRAVFIPSLVLASVYFAVMSIQTASIVFPTINGIGEAMASGSKVLLEQPAVQNLIEDSTAGLKTDGTDQSTLATGIGSRLISGDSNSLKNYIATHSSMSRAEVDERVSQIQSDFRAAAQRFSNATGNALIMMSWTLMITLLLGSLASWGGASLAFKEYRDSSVSDYDTPRRVTR